MDGKQKVRLLLVAASGLLVAACDGKVRSEFVAGCMSKGAPEGKCICVYEKLKDKYGVDALKSAQRGETQLPGFVEASVIGAAQCSGVDADVAMKQLGLKSDGGNEQTGSPEEAAPQGARSTAPASAGQTSDEAVMDSAIAITAGSNAGDEYKDAREVATGDLNGDGADDAAVVFTIEYSAQNNSTQFLSAFLRQGDGVLKFAGTTPVGGTGNAIDGVSVEDGAIRLTTLTLGPDDADCCPSIVGKVEYLLHNGKLKRVE